jgi:hypothetical protein
MSRFVNLWLKTNKTKAISDWVPEWIPELIPPWLKDRWKDWKPTPIIYPYPPDNKEPELIPQMFKLKYLKYKQ